MPNLIYMHVSVPSIIVWSDISETSFLYQFRAACNSSRGRSTLSLENPWERYPLWSACIEFGVLPQCSDAGPVKYFRSTQLGVDKFLARWHLLT